jgi:hypothetical protein
MSVTHPTKIHNDARAHDILLGGVLAYMAVLMLFGMSEPQLPHWLRFAGCLLSAASSIIAYRMVFPSAKQESPPNHP